MKYLRLFEQFEDEEESWWDNPSIYDNKKDLKIIKHIHSENDLYIMVLDGNITDKIKLFDIDVLLSIRSFDINPDVFDEDFIYILDRYQNKKIKYKDLPKEIKDRLI